MFHKKFAFFFLVSLGQDEPIRFGIEFRSLQAYVGGNALPQPEQSSTLAVRGRVMWKHERRSKANCKKVDPRCFEWWRMPCSGRLPLLWGIRFVVSSCQSLYDSTTDGDGVAEHGLKPSQPLSHPCGSIAALQGPIGNPEWHFCQSNPVHVFAPPLS